MRARLAPTRTGRDSPRWLFLRPAEILADEFVEALIVLVEELPQLRDHHRTDARVTPALALPQTLLRRLIPQAVEALGVIEVEVVPADARLEPEEVFDATQLRHRILYELIAVHYEDLLSGEHLQPTVHVGVIEGDGHRPVRLVDGAVRSHHKFFETARHLLLLLQLLQLLQLLLLLLLLWLLLRRTVR